MGTSRELVMDEAIAWHLGLEQAGAEEWRLFTAWLEADPAHAEAYDRLTLDDDSLSAPMPPMACPCPAERSPFVRRWVRWGGAGGSLIAAAAAAAWLALMPATIAPGLYSVETAPGVHRSVTLADGTRIDLNGATRLTLDRRAPRTATLDRGEAIFHVVHHADQPFEVRSGGVTLRDVGTVFNVTRSTAGLRVAVAEGSVLYQPEAEAVPLTGGMVLARRDADGVPSLGHVDAASVGGWANGHLDFRDASLVMVAEDVSRSTGAMVRIAPAMAAQHFTGTLRLDRPATEVVATLAVLADGTAHRDGPDWVIAPRTGGGH